MGIKTRILGNQQGLRRPVSDGPCIGEPHKKFLQATKVNSPDFSAQDARAKRNLHVALDAVSIQDSEMLSAEAPAHFNFFINTCVSIRAKNA